MKRCAWVPLDDPEYVQYHDEEWGEVVWETAARGCRYFDKIPYNLNSRSRRNQIIMFAL